MTINHITGLSFNYNNYDTKYLTENYLVIGKLLEERIYKITIKFLFSNVSLKIEKDIKLVQKLVEIIFKNTRESFKRELKILNVTFLKNLRV